jgi:nitrous oxidase accessory protein NosD
VPAAGRTITVDPLAVNGSLQAAIARLRDGDTLVLRPGRYEGGATLQGLTGVTLRGEPGAIVDGRGRMDHGLLVVEAIDVTIEGLAFRDFRLNGLQATRAPGLRVRRSEAAGCGRSGFVAIACPGVRFADCWAHHNGAEGIDVARAGAGAQVLACRVERNGRDPASGAPSGPLAR